LPQAAIAAGRVVAVTFDHVIHPVSVEILSHALDQAKKEDAAAVLIRLNTPGGLYEATRGITEKIVASSVPVITYVTPAGGRAASAGFFILEAGDLAAMAPGTRTGAASPVLIGQEMDPVMRRKVEEDAAAALRSVCAKRGRNSELAEKTVSQAKAFTDKEALDNKLIEVLAASETALLDQIDGREVTRLDGRKQTLHTRGAAIVDYQPSWRERLISSIADPNIAFVLLILGALGVYVEFTSPGLILPGVAGGIMVLLGLSALSVLPINLLGVALLVLALSFFVLEAKFASHGILGTGGAVAMVLGAMMLVEGPPELRIRFTTALSTAVPFAVITMFLLTLVVRARRNKVATGVDALMQEVAVARTPLAPRGKVFLHGEYWDAVSSGPVEAGGQVRVVAIDGLTLRVEPVSRSVT
jgi:membrane-bound serine protease (ClpP class)